MSSTPLLKRWNLLLQSNQNFVKDHTFAQQRISLKNQQNPSVVLVCCSDSRVAPELIFNETLGSLFVIRIAGGVVDELIMNSIEFAVTSFDIHLVVILGHSECAAVTNALHHLQKNNGVPDQPYEQFGAMLIPIEKSIVKAKINIHGTEALQDSIHAQIRSTADHLLSASAIISDALAHNRLIIVGAEYHLPTGNVHQLFVIAKDG